jgi:hypothetical protein
MRRWCAPARRLLILSIPEGAIVPRQSFSSMFSHALHRLFHGAPNRRAGGPLRRSRTSARLTLEYLESRALLSSYIIEDWALSWVT